MVFKLGRRTSGGFSFWKLWHLKDVLCYWQEDGGSLLTQRFMAMAEQRHKVPKLAKRVLKVFFESIGNRNKIETGNYWWSILNKSQKVLNKKNKEKRKEPKEIKKNKRKQQQQQRVRARFFWKYKHRGGASKQKKIV